MFSTGSDLFAFPFWIGTILPADSHHLGLFDSYDVLHRHVVTSLEA